MESIQKEMDPACAPSATFQQVKAFVKETENARDRIITERRKKADANMLASMVQMAHSGCVPFRIPPAWRINYGYVLKTDDEHAWEIFKAIVDSWNKMEPDGDVRYVFGSGIVQGLDDDGNLSVYLTSTPEMEFLVDLVPREGAPEEVKDALYAVKMARHKYLFPK